MKCLSCNGDGWLRRTVPHPGIPGCMVTATSPCAVCKATGKVPDSGNLFATEKENSNAANQA